MVWPLPQAERRLRAQLGSKPAGTDQASTPQKGDRRSSCLSAQADTWRSTATQKVRLAMLLALGSSIQQFPPPGETTEKGRRVFLAAPLGISKERRRRPRPQLQANHPFKVARSNKG